MVGWLEKVCIDISYNYFLTWPIETKGKNTKDKSTNSIIIFEADCQHVEWQLQGECVKTRMDVYQVLFDKDIWFSQRMALWEILGKLGYPGRFINLLRCFYGDMKTCINVGSKLSESIEVKNGVKKRDIFLLPYLLFTLKWCFIWHSVTVMMVYIYASTCLKTYLISGKCRPMLIRDIMMTVFLWLIPRMTCYA